MPCLTKDIPKQLVRPDATHLALSFSSCITFDGVFRGPCRCFIGAIKCTLHDLQENASVCDNYCASSIFQFIKTRFADRYRVDFTKFSCRFHETYFTKNNAPVCVCRTDGISSIPSKLKKFNNRARVCVCVHTQCVQKFPD